MAPAFQQIMVVMSELLGVLGVLTAATAVVATRINITHAFSAATALIVIMHQTTLRTSIIGSCC